MKTETAIKERPIIFTGENVRKILAGTKTQTRRILTVKHIPRDTRTLRFENQTADELSNVARCPYGKPGDRLWVKERYGVFTREPVAKTKKWWPGEPLYWGGIPEKRHQMVSKDNRVHSVIYASDGDTDPPTLHLRHWWSHTMFMPRWASRLTLEITDVRVQQVQEIGRDGWKAVDVLAEGITCEEIAHQQRFFHPDDSPAIAFAVSWDRINGKGSWRSNPWVWAITFRVVT